MFCDKDGAVISFIKINEHYHNFAHISYIRADGLLASYSPDFMVRTKDTIYIVETKSQDKLSANSVRAKQLATVEYLEKINELPADDRIQAEWKYVLLGENTFYSMEQKGANLIDILEYVYVGRNQITGELFQ